jgi:hypothetical protein
MKFVHPDHELNLIGHTYKGRHVFYLLHRKIIQIIEISQKITPGREDNEVKGIIDGIDRCLFERK